MRIVYFHGWGGKVDDAKLKILSKFGDDVSFPSIDYQAQRNLINAYTNEIYGKQVPTLIIGNSLGGYMAFHISNTLGFPALMFNPSFYFKNGGEIRPESNSGLDRKKIFILSGKDEFIENRRTLKYLKENEVDESSVKIYEDLGHQIPLDVFEKEFTEFREKYKDFQIRIEDKKSKSSDLPPEIKKRMIVESQRQAQRERRILVPSEPQPWELEAQEERVVAEPQEPEQWEPPIREIERRQERRQQNP